jgi:hypothetical protein
MVHQAHAALHEAMESPGAMLLAGEVITLVVALDAIEDLDPEAMGWGWAWPRLSDDDDRALLRLAGEAETAAGALIAAMAALAANSGTENELKCAVAGVKS